MPDPCFVALAGIEAAKDASSVKIEMQDRSGQLMRFEMTQKAADDLIGALRIDLGRMLQESRRQQTAFFVTESLALGSASLSNDQKHPTLELRLVGGGTVHLVIPQLMLEALREQIDQQVPRTPKPVGGGH